MNKQITIQCLGAEDEITQILCYDTVCAAIFLRILLAGKEEQSTSIKSISKSIGIESLSVVKRRLDWLESNGVIFSSNETNNWEENRYEINYVSRLFIRQSNERNIEQGKVQNQTTEKFDVHNDLNNSESKLLKDLIALGQDQGYITLDEISNHLGDEPITSEQMEKIFITFSELEIDILESPPEDKFNKKEFDKKHKVDLINRQDYQNVGLLSQSEDNILERDLYRKDLEDNERRIELEQNFKKEEELKDLFSRCGLTPIEEKVLRMRFGLDEVKDHTLEEVGQDFDVTRERIRQIEAKALRKLRHPSRAKLLKKFYESI